MQQMNLRALQALALVTCRHEHCMSLTSDFVCRHPDAVLVQMLDQIHVQRDIDAQVIVHLPARIQHQCAFDCQPAHVNEELVTGKPAATLQAT